MLDQEYLRPQILPEAVEIKGRYGKDARALAGGTDIIINLRENMISCKYLMDIKKIPEMTKLEYCEGAGLSIGGGVPLNALIDCPEIPEDYEIIKTAARTLANSMLRNRATLLGNLCNASPGGDMLPAALVVGGYVEAISTEGKRMIPLKEFFLGVKKNALKENELAVRVVFPPVKGKGVYLKKQRIKGHDLSQVGVAGYLREDGTLSIALGAVAPTPVLLDDLGRFSKEELRNEKVVSEIVEKVMNVVNPISDQRSSREYRIAMARYFTVKVLEELAKEV